MRLNREMLLLALLLAATSNALASNTWYVNGLAGRDSNDCKSLRTACKTIGHAISLASSGDSIMVADATYTENLTIGISLNLIGASAPKKPIVDGGGNNSVITISSPTALVTLSSMTIQNGTANIGGGIHNAGKLTINASTVSGNRAYTPDTCKLQCSATAGGIYNTGTLTINNSTVSGNGVGPLECKGRCYTTAGGIYTSGTLTINNSTISGNGVSLSGCGTICVGTGGGIFNGGTLTINNSTISGNGVSTYCQGLCASTGGGISNGGRLRISNSTISSNSATKGGGIYGTATFQNSIVANSSSGGNCSGMMTSNGYNLSSDGTCNFSSLGDINNTDPKLGPLQNNGGPTQTMALPSGSPAIDAGNPNGCKDGNGHLLTTDQRGMPRPDPEDTGGCDMGAYESQSD